MLKEIKLANGTLNQYYPLNTPHTPRQGVYLSETVDAVSSIQEVAEPTPEYLESNKFDFSGVSDTSCPFTHGYVGYVKVENAGTYEFFARSNFGIRMTVYNKTASASVVQDHKASPETTSVGEITFSAPGYYKVIIQYYSDGTASPVLKPYFRRKTTGRSASDSAETLASADEMVLYTTFLPTLEFEGGGNVLRIGSTQSLTLKNTSSTYVSGGTMTIFYPTGAESSSFSGAVYVPQESIQDGGVTVIPESGYPFKITALVYSYGGCGCTGTSATYEMDGRLVGEHLSEDCPPDDITVRTCACSNSCQCGQGSIIKLESVDFEQNFGRTPWIAGVPGGTLLIHEERPVSTLITPKVLKYRHVMRRKVLLPTSSGTTPSGVNPDQHQTLSITDGCGRITTYDITTGLAVGYSTQANSQIFVEENGWREVFPDRSEVKYDSAGDAVCFKTADGVEHTAAEIGIDVVETTTGGIQQIYSPADGLLDINSITSSGNTGGYTIGWYAPSAVPGTKSSGRYVISSGATPVKIFTFSGILVTSNMHLQLTEYRDAAHVYYYQWGYTEVRDDWESCETWTLTRGSGTDAVTKERCVSQYGGTNFQVSTTISGFGSSYTSETQMLGGCYGNAIGSTSLNSETDLGSSNRVSSSSCGAGRVCETWDRTSSYTSNAYDSYGRIVSVESYWLDDSTITTHYTYLTNSSGGVQDLRPICIARFVEDETIVDSTSYSYGDNLSSGRSETITQYENAGSSTQSTVRVWYPVSTAVSGGSLTSALNYSEGRLKSVQYPDGRMTSYTYSGPAISCAAPASNAIFTESATEGYANNAGAFTLLPGRTTRTVNSRNICGDIVKTERFVYTTGGAFVSLGSDTFQYNVQHKQTSAAYANGKTTSASWICAGPTLEIDVEGATTTYSYNNAKRLTGKCTIRPFSSASGTAYCHVVSETYTLDLDGRPVSTTIVGGTAAIVSGGAVVLTGATVTASASQVFDSEGRIVSSVDTNGIPTSWVYSDDGCSSTEIHADGGTVTTENHADGLTSCVYGEAVISQFMHYSFDHDTCLKEHKTYFGGYYSDRCVSSFLDGLGRTVKTERPAFDGSASITSNFYNAKGQLVSTTTTGQPAVSYTYDAMGNQTAQILTGGTIQRIQSASTNFISSGGAVWQVSVQSAFASDTNVHTSTIPLVTSQVAKLYPLSLAEEARQIQVDVRGNSAVTIQSFNPATRKHTASQIIPGVTNIASTVTRDGLQLTSIDLNGGTMSIGYDAFNRQITQTDPRGNTTSRVYNSNGQVVSVVDPTSAVTSYAYDSVGRVSQIVNALGGTVSYAYDVQGRKTLESGNATYPVSYGYNSLGEMISYATYRTAGNPDVTSCTYDSATGLLTAKVYANSSATVYSYNSAGLPVTRTWARTQSNGSALVTSYTYDSFQQLTSQTYINDEVVLSGTTYTTPSVSHVYDPMGRLTQTIDGGGTTSSSYTSYGEVSAESHALIGAEVSYLYDSLGRMAGIVGTSGGSTFYESTQSYNTLTGLINSATFGTSGSFAFSYVPGTNLESSIVTPVYTKLNTYEVHRDLPTEIKYQKNDASATVIGNRNYTYDALGRVVTRLRAREGGNGDTFSYNPKSELTSATIPFGGSPNYSYVYDNIGNRQTASASGSNLTYTTNQLNQYTNISGTETSYIQPTFDADGNQTSYYAKDCDGEYSGTIAYNGENQAAVFDQSYTGRIVTCQYDAMGRRVAKRVWFRGSDLSLTYFLYSGYLQIAEFSASLSTGAVTGLINKTFWDPTQPVATRVLASIPNPSAANPSTTYYTHDLTKNTCEMIDSNNVGYSGELDYTPFGAFTQDHGSTIARFCFSSEYFDQDLGLYYYIHRYYNPFDGRWLSRDPIGEEGGVNLYCFCNNHSTTYCDVIGLETSWLNPIAKDYFIWKGSRSAMSGSLQGLKWSYRGASLGLKVASNWTKDELVRGYNRAEYDIDVAYGWSKEFLANVYKKGTNGAKDVYNMGQQQFAQVSVCVMNGVICSVNYLSTDEALFVGWFSGPTKDMIVGLSKFLIGKKIGLDQFTDGTHRLLINIAADIGGAVYGNTYGKYIAMEYVFSDLENPKFRDYILPIIIPNMGNYGGAHYGTDQIKNAFTPFLNVTTKIEKASIIHDLAMEENEIFNVSNSEAHMNWVKNTWSGDDSEPGPMGQGYRLIGTPAFIFFSFID